MNIEQIRAGLLENGSCRPYVDGVLYNTIHNCSKDALVRELEDGWELAGIFRGQHFVSVSDVSGTPNVVVLRRKAPKFFHDDNPWRITGPHPWLPKLSLGVSNALSAELADYGGHGCPVIARRYRCRCGGSIVTVDFDQSRGRLEACCAKCSRRSVIMSVDEYQGDFDSLPVLIPTLITSWLRSRKKAPGSDLFRYARYTSWCGFLRKPKPLEKLKHYRCQCGKDRVTLDLGIEYPITATDGWDFSWLTAAATCQACNQHAVIFETETAGQQ